MSFLNKYLRIQITFDLQGVAQLFTTEKGTFIDDIIYLPNI